MSLYHIYLSKGSVCTSDIVYYVRGSVRIEWIREHFAGESADTCGDMIYLAKTVNRIIPAWVRDFNGIDSDEYWYAAAVAIWARWVILVCCLFEVNYRVDHGALSHLLSTLYFLPLIVANWYIYQKTRSRQTIRPRWLFLVSAMDIAAISFGVSLSGGFSSHYFLLYYPAAMFSWMFMSPPFCLVWTSTVAILYVALCFGVEPGLNIEAQEEKTLFYRVLALYAVCGSVSCIMRFEQIRRRSTLARERELNRQRIELSQKIHDTIAQSAYLLGLGVETALDLVDKSDRELSGKLEAMGELSRSTMWELRHPIDGGQIFNGMELGQTLRAHAETFTAITSIPAKLVQTGAEPQLSTITRSLVFSIAHNALTNAFRHANARSVTISLDFEPDQLRVSVSDDGIGMPTDYTERGQGIRNMKADAERMRGSLEVKSDGNGTSVSCIIPYDQVVGGW